MKYTLYEDRIELECHPDFHIADILECGQVFRFQKLEKESYQVITGSHKAIIETSGNQIIIWGNPKRMEEYFDLKTNYTAIKEQLKVYSELMPAIEAGQGIRILRQEKHEMILSFIISSNNNIPRIKKSIEHICTAFGKNMGTYFAFPTLDELANASEDFFKQAGLGYRSKYIVQTIANLRKHPNLFTGQESTPELIQKLQTLSGVGPKVADCIALFGFYKTDVFPTDTWILQAYPVFSNGIKLAKTQSNKFGLLAGYAQQYVYHYVRNINPPPKQKKKK